MTCPHNHRPGAAVHSAGSAGAPPLSLSPFTAAEAPPAPLYGQALTPTGSVNRGQVLKSNPPILTSIKAEGASQHLGRSQLKHRSQNPLRSDHLPLT